MVIYSPQKGNEHEKEKKLARPSLTSKKLCFEGQLYFLFSCLLGVNAIIQFPVQFIVNTSPTMNWNVNENIQKSTVSVHYKQ